MSKLTNFKDGVKSLVSSLINQRLVTSQNVVVSTALDANTLRQVYRHGIMNKIIRLKSGGALKDTIQFETTEDKKYYDKHLAQKVKRTTKWMLAFGRGIIVIHRRGDDLSTPLGTMTPEQIQLEVFSGDMVTTGDIERDLDVPRYYKPITYNVRGHVIHWSRVVDFTYVEPPELDAPGYMYGGVSETELIYEQLIADGIVQRAAPKIIEKASIIFYKVEGFKDAMRTGREADMKTYFTEMNNIVGLYSAGLVDKEDEIEAIQQTIANLADADQITLRRLAMVSGISLTALVGESPKGMNATGDNERAMDQDMIEALQSDYLLEPINQLMRKCGQGLVTFKENQGETPLGRIEFETKAITNAKLLWEMGEDYLRYLENLDVLQKDDFAKLWDTTTKAESEGDESVDPASALNGAQVTALLEIIRGLKAGEMTRATAVNVIMTAFPVSETQAKDLIADVPEGVPSAGEEN